MKNFLTNYDTCDDFVKSCIHNGKINIDHEDFKYADSQWGVDEVRKCLVDNIFELVDFPITRCSENVAADNFVKLCDFPIELQLSKGNTVSRFEYETYKTKLYISNRNTQCLKVSDYFLHDNRMAVGTEKHPAPKVVWSEKKHINLLLKSIWSLKMFQINENTLKSAIGNKHYICAQFNPSIAKCIYDTFKAERILDFSMGWGDRLCGFFASKYGKHYVGVDPNVSNHACYNKEAEFLNGLLKNKKTHEFIIDGAEFVDYSKYYPLDLAFTSPPYFSKELYSDDEKQSFKNYKTGDAWKTGFLYKTMENIKKGLKENGYLIVNISDVNISDKRVLICDDMVKYAESIGYEYIGGFGMQLAKRPNKYDTFAFNPAEDIYVEPCFVFKNGKYDENSEIDYQIRNSVLVEKKQKTKSLF